MSRFTFVAAVAAVMFHAGAAVSAAAVDECKRLFDEALWQQMMAPCIEAAESADRPAQTMLGEAYDRNGDSVQTLRWWTQAADAGYLPARNLLAMKYYYGGSVFGPEEGWQQDYHKAFEIWHPDAQKGVATSQQMVGSMYYHGQGVERDLAASWFWLTRAQQNGDKHATELLYELSTKMTSRQRRQAMEKLAAHDAGQDTGGAQ